MRHSDMLVREPRNALLLLLLLNVEMNETGVQRQLVQIRLLEETTHTVVSHSRNGGLQTVQIRAASTQAGS